MKAYLKHKPEPRLKLKSDFRDYYDPFFDVDGYEITRHTWAGPLREIAFVKLSHHFNVPDFGLVEKVAPLHSMVVVYTHSNLHRGDGKELMDGGEALASYPNHFCSQYLAPYRQPWAETERLLFVGTTVFSLRYRSDDTWRSNCGNVHIDVLNQDVRWGMPFMEHPLLAIDFVRTVSGAPFAIDFNVAPQIKGTGIEDIYSGRKIVNYLKEWAHVYA